MSLYLIAGTNSDAVKQALENNGIPVVRTETSISESLRYLTNNHLEYDFILLTDQGVINDYDSFSDILSRLKLVINPLSGIRFLTKDPNLEMIFKSVLGPSGRYKVYLSDQIKIPVSTLIEFCNSQDLTYNSQDNTTEDRASAQQSVENTVLLKKNWSIFNKFKSKTEGGKAGSNEETSKPLPSKKTLNEKNLPDLSSCKKVVAITGHRGSGVTGTVANIASVASAHGMSVMVVDMDIVYRGINLFFPKFGDEVEIKPELGNSLIRCLMKPDSYEVNCCRINENLWVITLAYSASNKAKPAELMDYKRVLSLISLLRQKYNLVLLDLPMDILKYISDLITQVDSIGLCVNNNLYSVINTVKDIEESIFEDFMLFRTKSRVIISKYNESNKYQGKRFSPEFTCEMLNQISGVVTDEYRNCGVIPYSKDFDLQTGKGERICNTDTSYRNCYFELLTKLL